MAQAKGDKPVANYLELLTPKNSQLLFIDQQPQMAFGVQSIDRQVLKNIRSSQRPRRNGNAQRFFAGTGSEE